MKASTALRVCVVLDWVIYLVLWLVLSCLPTQEWSHAGSGRSSTFAENFGHVSAALVYTLDFSVLVASVGLLLLRRWAAWLFVINIAAFLIVQSLTGPMFYPALRWVQVYVAGILSGVVIGLAFFTDALQTPDRPSEQKQTPPLTEVDSP